MFREQKPNLIFPFFHFSIWVVDNSETVNAGGMKAYKSTCNRLRRGGWERWQNYSFVLSSTSPFFPDVIEPQLEQQPDEREEVEPNIISMFLWAWGCEKRAAPHGTKRSEANGFLSSSLHEAETKIVWKFSIAFPQLIREKDWMMKMEKMFQGQGQETGRRMRVASLRPVSFLRPFRVSRFFCLFVSEDGWWVRVFRFSPLFLSVHQQFSCWKAFVVAASGWRGGGRWKSSASF